jgi:hypothetical protein
MRKLLEALLDRDLDAESIAGRAATVDRTGVGP